MKSLAENLELLDILKAILSDEHAEKRPRVDKMGGNIFGELWAFFFIEVPILIHYGNTAQ